MEIFDYCTECGKQLSYDEIGLHKKLVNRGAEQFMCMQCLCARFDLTVGEAEAMIERFRADGCMLFSQKLKR